MILSALVTAALCLAQGDSAIAVNRVYAKGEKLEYDVKAQLQQEWRQRGLNTWMPEDQGVEYRFSFEVTDVNNGGMATIRYKRPTMTMIEGESADSEPKRTIEKTGWDLQLTVSPINEVVEIKDLKKKPTPKGKGAKLLAPSPKQVDAIIASLTDGMAEMVLFIGSPDSGLDFSPKLPIDDVKTGDTWKKTVGYTPQKLKGKENKMAVQRLDYTYSYGGLIDVGGKKVLRIHAELTLETDMGAFINQLMDVKPEASMLKEIPFKLKSQIDFDLDPTTRKTLKAVATSSGEGHLTLKGNDDPVDEMRLHGKTTMKLVPSKP